VNLARSAADDPIEIIGAIGIIPVVIIDDAAQAAPLAEALIAGGIGAAEITLPTPAAMAALEIMAPFPGFLVGAGTLLAPAQVARIAGAGARFAVSPGSDPRVVDACQARAMPVLPGAPSPRVPSRWPCWATARVSRRRHELAALGIPRDDADR
jgi:Entner-Doudoroff aldolase